MLGLVWEPESDCLHFKVNLDEQKNHITKRIVASQGARLFDPNGYITPITIRSKIFMQNLWRIGVTWDEELSSSITEEWKRYYASLHEVQNISIPRWIGLGVGLRIQLHAFCDASLKAYGVVIYVQANKQMVKSLWRCLHLKVRLLICAQCQYLGWNCARQN